MDILAARKKAAELAKAGKAAAENAPAVPAREEPVPPAAEMPPVAAQAAPADAGAGTGGAAPPVAPPEAPASEPAAEVSEPQQEQELEMLSFRLGSEDYLVPVELVAEVLTPREITSVPHVPSYILGVCSLRGAVLPIIDLTQRLGLGKSARDDKSRIVVVTLGTDDQVGLFVDRVQSVVRIPASSVRPAPETVEQGEAAEFLRGIARKDERLYILLDVEKAIEG
jgi:purine-binding chemotaxis protein CheW